MTGFLLHENIDTSVGDEFASSDGVAADSSSESSANEYSADGQTVKRELLVRAIEFNQQRLKLLVPPIKETSAPDVLAMMKRLQSMESSEEAACIKLIDALSRTRQPSALTALMAVADSDSKDVRQAVAAGMFRIRHPLSAYLLLPRLADESSRVRQAALQALVYLAQPCTAESILAATQTCTTLRFVFKDCVKKLTSHERSKLFKALNSAKDFDPALEEMFGKLVKYFVERAESRPTVTMLEEGFAAAESANALRKQSTLAQPVSQPRESSGSAAKISSSAGNVARKSFSLPVAVAVAIPSAKTEALGTTEIENGASTVSQLTFAPRVAVPEISYRTWFKEEVLPSRVFTIFFTFYVHWITLLCLASIYISSPELFTPMAFNAIFGEEEIEAVPFTAILESDGTPLMNTEVASSEAAPSAIESSEVIAQDQLAISDIPSAIAAMAGAGSEGETSNVEGPAKAVASDDVRAPAQAVTAGSFSVWTVPDDPDPGEPYKIMIQIRVPNGTEKYSVSDLEGVIVGSDGYQKIIPGAVRGFLPVSNGMVKLEVHIVSADEKVEDTVFIRSRLLREAQRLTIRF